MKTLMIAVLASTTLAMTVPAIAQAHPETYATDDDDWNNGGDSYAEFNQEYAHIWQGIQHGLGDGSFTRSEAGRFYREMQSIRARAEQDERYGNYDPQLIQARLERLHDWMHRAHERGHERQESYYGNNYGNGNDYSRDRYNYYRNPNSGYYYNRR